MTPRPLPLSDARSGAHKVERSKWRNWLDRGNSIQCCCTGHCGRHTRCITIITSRSAWDLAHNDDRTGWIGPECIPCNRGAGAINSNSGGMTVRDWPGG